MPSKQPAPPPKPQDHYGPEVQKALQFYQQTCIGMWLLNRCDFKERIIRIEAIQGAWNMLALARKKETGCGLYLTPEEHREAVAKLKESTT